MLSAGLKKAEWYQSLNQPDSTQQHPCLPSYAISPAANSLFSLCVCVCQC